MFDISVGWPKNAKFCITLTHKYAWLPCISPPSHHGNFLSRVHTVGRFLIAWLNDCSLSKSGLIVNEKNAMVDPVQYYSIHVCL